MNAVPGLKPLRYTYADYISWDDEARWELIDGIAHAMSPAPSVAHQNIAGALFALLREKLKGGPCRAFIAPLDVVLSETDVVQPDVFVVCNPAIIGERGVHGAPAWVAEVLSPATARKDMREKKNLYERSGIGEYVVFDPLERYVQRFVRGENDAFAAMEVFDPGEELPLGFAPGECLPLWEIFESSPAAI